MRYLFFVSWFRAREKKLADSVDLDRMIGAESIEESFKVLNDTDYASYISNKNHLDIEAVIQEERKDLEKTLSRMGMDKEVLNFLFLKDELFLLAKELKENIFEKKENKISQQKNIAQRIIKENPSSPAQIDNLISEIYFQELILFCRKTKEKQIVDFLEKYWQRIREKDDVLAEMEDEIIEKSRDLTNGIMPILAFFIRKRRIEYFIRSIFSAKRIGFQDSEIHNLITKTKTL